MCDYASGRAELHRLLADAIFVDDPGWDGFIHIGAAVEYFIEEWANWHGSSPPSPAVLAMIRKLAASGLVECSMDEEGVEKIRCTG